MLPNVTTSHGTCYCLTVRRGTHRSLLVDIAAKNRRKPDPDITTLVFSCPLLNSGCGAAPFKVTLRISRLFDNLFTGTAGGISGSKCVPAARLGRCLEEIEVSSLSERPFILAELYRGHRFRNYSTRTKVYRIIHAIVI